MLNDGLTGTLHFDNVRVPAECVVGAIGDGFSLAMAWINWRRLSRGGMCAGWGRWLLERARTFTRERKSGGHPIADLQAVQHLIADMDLNIYQAHAAALVALTELEALGGPYAVPLDHRAPRLVSLVKVINDEAFYRVTDNAVQVRGAVGLLLGSPEEKLFRVARNLRIPAGTSEIQRNAIARGVMKYS
jgi:alkylation response protein AidB-like acyl-CoA dehydrogenase